MKYLNHLLLISIFLLAATACESEAPENVAQGEITLVLNVPGATPSKAVAPDAGESLISNVYLLFYASGADADATPAAFYAKTGLTADATWSATLAPADLIGTLAPYTVYDVYILASLPGGTTPPDASTTKGAFLALTEQQFDRTADAPGISFTAVTTYTASAQNMLVTDLTRTVARIDVTLASAPADAIMQVLDEPSATFYQPGRAAATPSRTIHYMTKLADGRFRCYVYENAASSDKPIRLFVNSSSINAYVEELLPGGSKEIKRNHIYTVALTLTTKSATATNAIRMTNW